MTLDETILRALDQNPNLRFQTAAELRQALEAALREPERRRRRRRRVGFATLGAVALALGGVAFVGYRRPVVRARAEAALEPLLHRFDALRSEARGVPPAPARAAVAEHAAVAKSAPKVPPAPPPAAVPPPVETAAANAPPAAPAPSAHDDGPQVAAELDQAEQLMKRGNVFKGFDKIRGLAETHERDPAVLAAWSKAAQRVKAWGEAMRAAQKWAAVDPSPAAALNLARMQRTMGRQSAAVATLQRLLKRDPSSTEARALLQNLGGERRVADNE